MIAPSTRTRVFAYGAPCDMRKSFNTLSGLVSAMGHDVAAGDVFLFVAKNRKRAKVLWYDATGLVLLAKRLDVGRVHRQSTLSGPSGTLWQVIEPRPEARSRMKLLEIANPPTILDHA